LTQKIRLKLLIGRIKEDTKIWFQRHKKAFPGSKDKTDIQDQKHITQHTSAVLALDFSFVGTRNHATCDVYPPKAVETSMHGNVTDIVYFVVYKVYFLLYSGSVTLETNIHYLKGIASAMECADAAAFTFAT